MYLSTWAGPLICRENYRFDYRAYLPVPAHVIRKIVPAHGCASLGKIVPSFQQTTVMRNRFLLAAALCITYGAAQMSSAELDVLLNGLANRPQAINVLEKRVPLMTDDPTVAPLIDLQIFAPPVVPSDGDSCEVVLLTHTFGEFLSCL